MYVLLQEVIKLVSNTYSCVCVWAPPSVCTHGITSERLNGFRRVLLQSIGVIRRKSTIDYMNSWVLFWEYNWWVGNFQCILVAVATLVTIVILVVAVILITSVNWVNQKTAAQWRCGTILSDVIALEELPPIQLSITPHKSGVTGAIKIFQKSKNGERFRIGKPSVRFLTF